MESEEKKEESKQQVQPNNEQGIVYNYVIPLEDPDLIVKERVSTQYIDKYVTLKPAAYKAFNVGGLGFIPGFSLDKPVEDLVSFESGVVKELVDRCNEFFTDRVRKEYAAMNLSHKMGAILYGKQGVGKTSCCYLVMHMLIEKYDAICLNCTNLRVWQILSIIKTIRKHQDNLIVIFVDEYDSSVRKEEEDWLTFLDGSDSKSNILFLGCTNYLDKIPERIRKRKSRIKHLVEVKAFPFDVYKQYIKKKKANVNDEVLGKMAYLSVENGLTIDQCKHLMIDYFIEGLTMEESIEEILKLEQMEVKRLKDPEDNN